MLDDEIHHLVGARPDHEQPCVAQHALDGIYTGVADAAHDLHGVVDHLPGNLGGELLGLGDHASCQLPVETLVDSHRCSMHQRACGIDLGDAVCDFEAHRLKVPYPAAEGLSLIAVACGDLKGTPRAAHAASGSGHPLRDHHPVEDLPTLAFPSDDVLLGDPDIAEQYPPCPTSPRSHEPVDMLHLHPHVLLHHKQAQRLACGGLWVRLSIDQEVVRSLCADNETLLSRQSVMATVLASNRGSPEEVRSAAGLGQRLRAAQLRLEGGLEVFPPLLLAPEHLKRLAADANQPIEAGKGRG